MRRVSLLLLAVGLLVACNDKDDYQPEKDPIYLADKIVENILPVQGTHTMSITSEYKYRNTGIGLLEKMTVDTVATSKIPTSEFENSYDGSFPTKTVYKESGIQKSETVYNEYTQRGSIKKKTTTEVGKAYPIIEEYKYDGRLLSEYVKTKKTSSETTVYTIITYKFGLNEVNTETSVRTETVGYRPKTTVVATDKYVLNYNETVKEHTRTENGKTSIITYTYDNKTNPRYLLFSYRMTHPEFFLQEGYSRNNITKKTVKYPNISGQDYVEETTYEYFKNEYPQKAVVKRDGVIVGSKEFTY